MGILQRISRGLELSRRKLDPTGQWRDRKCILEEWGMSEMTPPDTLPRYNLLELKGTQWEKEKWVSSGHHRCLSKSEIILCDNSLHSVCLDIAVLKEELHDFLHILETDLWPLFWSKITTFLIRHYLRNLRDFSITKSLETCVSKTLFPWVADQLHWTVICWPVFML